ncbi:MAG: Transcriptional regulator, TrmB [Parcubacteria group bacterium Gr01-1014_29]|nr:MAG: Transcriptional regulator, TrmB [Parcubacteria group bacterium Gr01-1014_29]
MKSIDTLISQFTKIGLSQKSALLYARLLELGGAYPSRLAEITQINRSTVYKILTDLSIKGLVNEIQKGKKLYYQVERPSKLLRYAQYQVDNANDIYDNVKRIYPEIQGLYSLLPDKPKVLYFEGVDGIMSVYDDHISQGKKYEMLWFTNTKDIIRFFPKNYFKKYRQAKEKIGITTRGILPDDEYSKKQLKEAYADVSNKIKPVVRTIPKEKFLFKGEITIYGDNKISITDVEEDHMMGLIIENNRLHQMMRMVFELAWKGAV